MLDAYIIEKLKRENEEQERARRQWQPIPLPLEEYDPRDRMEREKGEKKEDRKEEHRGVFIIEFQSSRNIENLVL